MNNLLTLRGEELIKTGKRQALYPRPQLERDSFLSLDGEWDFITDGKKQSVLVPFCPESLLSGINKAPESSTFQYQKSFTLPNGFNRGRVILHFGAVDTLCTLFINGKRVGSHSGGYNSFSFDITDYLEKENTLTLSVTDTTSHLYPYGKQKKRRGGMWYTTVSGIWQSVWLESVPKEYVTGIDISVTLNTADLIFHGVENGRVYLEGKEYAVTKGKVKIQIDNPVNWTPENPYLYCFTAVFGEDTVKSYFALRTVEIKENKVLLNGEEYFFNGVLDQGYFSDGLYTPAGDEEYLDDILRCKSLGFNMLRKHIKVEPESFYYYCDKYGMAVFQDMVNNGRYSFLRDTALPTLGLQGRADKFTHNKRESRENFIKGMTETVNQLKNHPCIVQWTVFNEGWGQFCGDKTYSLLHSLDSTRLIDAASGWFKVKSNPFDSLHIYFKPLRFKKGNKPVFISEYGGYSYKIKEHSFNFKATYGYGKFSNKADFAAALKALFSRVKELKAEGLCAAVYTQVSDVEDETNGLLTYDRRVMKITPEDL